MRTPPDHQVDQHGDELDGGAKGHVVPAAAVSGSRTGRRGRRREVVGDAPRACWSRSTRPPRGRRSARSPPRGGRAGRRGSIGRRGCRARRRRGTPNVARERTVRTWLHLTSEWGKGIHVVSLAPSKRHPDRDDLHAVDSRASPVCIASSHHVVARPMARHRCGGGPAAPVTPAHARRVASDLAASGRARGARWAPGSPSRRWDRRC